MSAEITATLKSHPLFSRLSDQQLDRVGQHARAVSVAENQPLFHQGDAAEQFFYVCAGSIKLSRLAPDGNEKVIEFVNPGNTFAEALMFLEAPAYPVNASALTDAALIAVDSRDFTRMLKDSVETCFLLLGDMSQRLHGLISEIDTLSLQSGTCRVANYLLKLAPPDADTFKLDIPKGVMASRLSVKPETFSRILRHLQDDGIISIKGMNISIQNRTALEDQAAGIN